MKKIFTIMFSLALFAVSAGAQVIDESFVFTDENGEVIENGTTVIRNVVEVSSEGNEIINAGIFVKNMVGSTDYLKMHYSIERIDNGLYQICFPTNCNSQSAVGNYTTDYGQPMGVSQDIMSEWLPDADGECIVNLNIEVFTRQAGFPPNYTHKAWGPSITLRFIKGGEPTPEPLKGDVNGDGEVNISDVNAVIAIILNPDND